MFCFFRASFIVCAFLLVSHGLFAQDRAEAERLNTLARELYDNGRFKDALDSFVEAHKNFPDPRYLYNAGKASVRLKDLESAIHFYELFLKESPRDRDAAKLRQETARYQNSLKRKGLVPVGISSIPAGASVRINGDSHPYMSTTPVTRWLKTGEHEIRLALKGYEETKVNAKVRMAQSMEFQLKKPAAPFVLEVSCKAGRGNCTVFLDGKEIPQANMSKGIRLKAGARTLQASAPGFVTQEKKIEASPGMRGKVDFVLEAVRTPVTASPPAGKVEQTPQKPRPTPKAPPKKEEKKPTQKTEPQDQGPQYSTDYRLLSYIAMGLGAVGVVGGAVLYGVGTWKMNSAREDYDMKLLSYDDFRRSYNTGRNYLLGSYFAMGAGAVCGVGGLILYAFTAEPQQKISFYPTIDMPGFGIVSRW